MNVIGLGKAGCEIASKFEKYPPYTVYKIDVGKNGERCFDVPEYETTEEYEEKLPHMGAFLKEIDGDTLFILAGGGAVSCACLRILEALNSRDITILYIQPELTLLNGIQASRESLVRGVLQQYARCALLKRMYLISNTELEKIVGEVPIMTYFDKLNEILVSTLHMIHIFENSEPVMGKIERPRDVCRISTFGMFDLEKSEEKMFFPLDKVRDICYIYGINKDKLQTDGTLYRSIVDQTKQKVSKSTNVSYAVFSTNYQDDIFYCVAHASYVQS